MVHRRNKELRIADESEGGWEMVAAYISHSVADDAADSKAIRRADKVGKERMAAKQRKNNRPYRRPFNRNYRDESYTPDRDYYCSVGSNRIQDSAQRQHTFRSGDTLQHSLYASTVANKATGKPTAQTSREKRIRQVNETSCQYIESSFTCHII